MFGLDLMLKVGGGLKTHRMCVISAVEVALMAMRASEQTVLFLEMLKLRTAQIVPRYKCQQENSP